MERSHDSIRRAHRRLRSHPEAASTSPHAGAPRTLGVSSPFGGLSTRVLRSLFDKWRRGQDSNLRRRADVHAYPQGTRTPRRLIRLPRPCGTRHAISLFHSDCPSRPPRQSLHAPTFSSDLGAPVLPVHPGRPRLTPFTGSDFRGVSSSPHQARLRFRFGRRKPRSVSSAKLKMRVFPRRHRSIPPLEGFACRPVPLYHPTDGAFRTPSLSRLTNILHLSDSPTSPPSSPTFLASTEMVPRAGLEPARAALLRSHQRADVAGISPAGTGKLNRRRAIYCGAAVCTIPALARDSRLLGTRICCARLAWYLRGHLSA